MHYPFQPKQSPSYVTRNYYLSCLALCCIMVCSPTIALQTLIFHSCSFLINTKSSYVLWCPLQYVILWLSRFWKNEQTKDKPFLAIRSTRAMEDSLFPIHNCLHFPLRLLYCSNMSILNLKSIWRCTSIEKKTPSKFDLVGELSSKQPTFD